MRRWLALCLAAGCAALAAAGCAGETADCFGASVRAGDYECALRSGGRDRGFRVHVPPGYRDGAEVPLVFVFHGGLGTGRTIEKQSGMNAVADRHGFVAVYPDGLYRTWNAGGCCERAMRESIDDVGFVEDMIAFLGASLAVDTARVYATGFSNGAMLAHRLACELPQRFAAVAPVSGVIMVPPCRPAEEVSVMVIHGTEDPRSLWEGGLGDKDPSKGVRESIPRTMSRLHARYGCGPGERVVMTRGAVTCTASEQCRDGAEVVLCRIEGGGHQWPGGRGFWPEKLGPVNRDIRASEVIWDFFERNPKPAGPAQARVRTRDGSGGS